MHQFGCLHSALSKEFVLPQHLASHELFQCTLQQLVDRGVVYREGVSLQVNERQLLIFEYLSQVIRPFVAGVWVCRLHIPLHLKYCPPADIMSSVALTQGRSTDSEENLL